MSPTVFLFRPVLGHPEGNPSFPEISPCSWGSQESHASKNNTSYFPCCMHPTPGLFPYDFSLGSFLTLHVTTHVFPPAWVAPHFIFCCSAHICSRERKASLKSCFLERLLASGPNPVATVSARMESVNIHCLYPVHTLFESFCIMLCWNHF